MSIRATVRSWDEDEGWGVIDSPETPGGCWTHFSAVAIEGFAELSAGQVVELEWEAADQDGFAFRATRAWPSGQEAVGVEASDSSDAYSSTLTISFDED